jgi:hypothetical protein
MKFPHDPNIDAPEPKGSFGISKNYDNYQEWLSYGIEKNWITDSFCYTHDTPELTDQEQEDFEEVDPCVPVIRVWEENIV